MFKEFSPDHISELTKLEKYINEIKKIAKSKLFSNFEDIETLERKIEKLLKIKYGKEIKVKIQFYKSFDEIKINKIEIYFKNGIKKDISLN